MQSVFFAATTLLAMSVPFTISEGVFFDSRSIVLTAIGAFAGPIPAIFTVFVSSLYRLNTGGDGMIMGVAVILTSGGLGMLFYYLLLRNPWLRAARYYYILGLIVHVLMLSYTGILPPDTRAAVLKDLWFPILILYPIVTTLVLALMAEQQDRMKRMHEQKQLQKFHAIGRRLTNHGIWLLDLEGKDSWWSPEMFTLFNFPIDQGVPDIRLYLNRIHPDDREKLLTAQERLLQHNRPMNIQFRTQLEDDTIRWYEVWGERAIPQTGQNKIIGATQDITQRKRTEVERQIFEKRFRIAQEMSPDGFTILQPVRDEKGEIFDFIWVYENNAVAKMNGTDPKKVVGRRLLDLFPGHRGTAFLNNYIQVAQTGEPLTFEEEYVGETLESPTWFRIVVVPMEDNIAILAQDITQRKQAEDLLKENVSRLAVAFENSPAFITIQKAENAEYISVNNTWSSITGYSAEEVVGKTTPDLNLMDSNAHELLLKEFKEKGAVRNVEVPLTIKDGSTRFILISSVLHSEGDKPLIFTTGIDITELKLKEAQLKQSEERFSLAFHSAPIGMALTRFEDGLIVDVNNAFLKISEFSRGELVGRKTTEIGIWSTETRERTLDQQKATGGLKLHEVMIYTKSGRELPILLSAEVIKINHVEHMLSNIVDISDNRKIEQALSESEANYKSLFENMNAGFVLFEVVQDTEGHPVDLLIVMANDGFRLTTGLDLKSSMGKHLTKVLPGIEKDEADWIGTYSKVALTGEAIQFEQGSELLGYYYSISAFKAGPNQCAVTFVDITKRKLAEEKERELEAQLRQSQKLEAVGTMAGGIAHDFNNILQGLYLYTNIIKEQLPDDDQVHSDFQHIIESGNRAKELVRQILTFSRKEEAIFKPTRIQYLIKDALKLIRASTPATIDIKENIDLNCGAVLCDAIQFHQVFINLCNNAIYAMKDKGGQLSVCLHQTESPIEVEPGKPFHLRGVFSN